MCRKIGLSVKYFLDKIAAVFGLIITSPIFFIVGIVLKIQGQDIFYLQKRVGYLGKEFEVYKFTTMPKGSEKLGLITTVNDKRPTRFGMFLRKTKINEIPQLINVLLGDMSLVGPRPLILEQISEGLNSNEIAKYYEARPGITGIGSLYFNREDRLLAEIDEPATYYSDVIIPLKYSLEKKYSIRWNLYLDLKILLFTMLMFVIDGFFNSEKSKQAFLDKIFGL